MIAREAPASPFTRWLLEPEVEDVSGPESEKGHGEQQPWWRVVCLTGVDYFSTLGYIPGIAALAVGVLSPIATVFIVLLTLFGIRPMYHWVAAESPHGRGSISMLERLLSFWKGKLFVLALLGFMATDYMITITLSDSDAATHLAANPLAPGFLKGQEVAITLFLVALLGAVFLKGFREAIWLSVVLVAAYLLLNLVVVFVGFYEIFAHPHAVIHWRDALLSAYGSPLGMIAVSALVFPKLALGVSGFETGVSVMPLVRGEPQDDPERPAGRIRNTRKLLNAAAVTMSFYLIATSFITIVLIPAKAFEPGGPANGRALSYLSHMYLGNAFGTVYDLSTIAILWFAGASAMAGLINVMPRYLPRYGMAPEWGRAIRPLVLVYTAIAFAIVIIFKASTDAQAGAYATGVLFVMSSAAVAVMLAARRAGSKRGTVAFALVTLVLAYTTVANVFERPDGIKIAAFFIVTIIVVSLASRVRRSLELRQEHIEVDENARRFIEEASERGEIHIITHRRRSGDDPEEYARALEEQREYNRVPDDATVLFLEIDVDDPSEFEEEVLEVKGVEVGGYKVLRAQSTVVPNAIAAFLLYLRDTTGKTPNCYLGWTQGNPFVYLVRYILFGEGDTAPIVHEVLREAEPDLDRRPVIHIGGK
jgi:hypothetical protein